jgi:uridine kinase
MKKENILEDKTIFCQTLFEKMKDVTAAIEKMEFYEFEYSLNNITPGSGSWSDINPDPMEGIQHRISSQEYFENIQIKPKIEGRIVLDGTIQRLTQMLFVGLVTGQYPSRWINEFFYFDPRSFNFYIRSQYLTDEIKAHLGGKPYRSYEQKQKAFDACHELGYQEFKNANGEVDAAFIEIILELVKVKGMPSLLGIAGPTAAGKTEIVERLRVAFEKLYKKISAIELDNFLLDRDYREENNIGSFGKKALHFGLLLQCLRDIQEGKKIVTPRYDFIYGTSSHDLQGNLKPDRKPVEVLPSDIIFIEGNSPFLMPEIAASVGIKVVYLTDDAVRLKRKWRRDIDYRKKYDPYYLRNRFFREQPPMARKNYQPQLIVCDIFVDTTGAAIWVTPEVINLLSDKRDK